jgi:hypothetical protein
LAATAREEARTAQLAPVIHEMQCRDYSIHSIAVELGKRKVPTPRGGTGIRNSASTAQLRTKLSRGRDYLDSCHYTAPRFQRGSRSRGHEADNRRGRNCSTARQCARNRVARIGNYRVLMRIGKVARSKVVRIGNRVARIGNYRVLMRIGKVARSKVVRIGNRVARIGNYRDLHIGSKVARSKVVRIGSEVARSKVVRIGNRVARIGNYRVLRASEADTPNCRALSWCQSRRRSHWLYRQRARLSL